MERGLLWLPLLAIFIGLTWAGWREYKKVEAYQRWAVDFDRHKYDIYAVLGQKGDRLTWGKPTRSQPVELQTISLPEIETIQLKLDRQVITDPSAVMPTSAKSISIELVTPTKTVFNIPFTEVSIAVNWFCYLLSEQARQDRTK